jgi:hypothetical protein
MRPHSRGAFSPELLQIRCPSQNRGRRECRVHAAPAVSCAKDCAFGAHEHTGERRTLRHPLRNGFTAYIVLSPVSGLVVTVTMQISLQGLAPASRRQDHTTSPYAAEPFAFGNTASIASRAQRVVTMAIRPSCRRETALLIILIFRNAKRNNSRTGPDDPNQLEIAQEIGFYAQRVLRSVMGI